MKPIQILTDRDGHLVALCDDGTIWEQTMRGCTAQSWQQIGFPSPPKPATRSTTFNAFVLNLVRRPGNNNKSYDIALTSSGPVNEELMESMYSKNVKVTIESF